MKGPFELPFRMVVDEDLEPVPSHITLPLLTSEECDRIVTVMKNHPDLSPGLVGDGSTGSYRESEFRVCDVQSMDEGEFQWLYSRVKDAIRTLNREYQFELYGIFDDLNFIRYTEPKDGRLSGRFGWHVDCGRNLSALRKLSLSIALNDPGEYEGGELQLMYNGLENLGKLRKGTVTAFPSHIPHRVSPITSGTRYVLVLFVLGPKFR